MARKKELTAKRVEALKKPGRYLDGRGLYLQVAPGGKSKSWLLRYEYGGRERWMGLGSIKTFSLKEARERANEKRKLLADGLDPIEEKIKTKDAAIKEARERVTFEQAAEQYLNLHADGWKNAKHRQQWKSTLAQHAFPKLGDRPVASIDTAMVNEAVMPIWTKTPETARRTRDRIERVIQWVKDGRPLPGVGKNGKRSHPALAWQELPAFMAELRQRDGVSARALEFTILTAVRTGETIRATWDEIDLDAKTWTIPAERMKASRAHRVPLSARTVEILRSMPHVESNPYVFARNGGGLSDMAMLEMLRGMRSGVTVHGFRSAFTDWAHEATATPKTVVDMALAHTVGDKVEAAYRRGDLFVKRRKLMSQWADYCARTPAEVPNLDEERKRRKAKR